MRKIGFVSSSVGWGGLEMNILKLSQWLTERNWELTLFVNKESRLYAESKKFNIKTQVIPNHLKYFDFIGAYRFSKVLKAHEISTIFVFDNRDLDFINITKKLTFKNLVVIYQQHMQIGVNKKDLIHTIRFSGINYWITPLDILKKEVEEKTRVDANKIKVIPLGIEIDKFIHAKYQKNEARDKLDINQSAFLLGILGRIDPKKGQLFLVQAIHEFKKRNINIELLIIGDPTLNDPNSLEYLATIQDYIGKNSLTNSVHFRNFTCDVGLFYNAIDLFALASESETYGMVTIEAMLSKVPIIATNSSGTPEILNYGEFGLLYTGNNMEDFMNKFSWIIENSEEAESIASKAQQHAIERYAHSEECKLIEELLIRA